MSSFKSSENIKKKEVGSDSSVSDNQSSSVTLHELAMKARKSYCNFKLQSGVRVSVMFHFMFVWCQSFGDVSLYVCSLYF